MKFINIDQEIMSGTPVFNGTRVPIKALFDNLEDGMSISDFMENYPTVKHEMIIGVLELAFSRVMAA